MKNKFGLLESDMVSILEIIRNQELVEEAILFGSRAKGNYRKGSDVDIALKGNKLNFETVSQISYLLNEETNMPYLFDLVSYHQIQEPELIKHIDRVGIPIFHRKKEMEPNNA
ncbi:nucleotidyltransferase domain-containing protein [Algoriphagus marincola]|uniref:Nucleotidyltransferase domain-containing protein n=1 Tax=Algoriphagus marincola TaxID=264027 RepID=A0ABS7N4W3_9BACT|nr:nucleotidyltransferase domain-containing protein [Algoriphagus marincola]MBY5951378.1 nucleotidyltransferase domain-containing protein [Algoriphagus marincola]